MRMTSILSLGSESDKFDGPSALDSQTCLFRLDLAGGFCSGDGDLAFFPRVVFQ